jgi:hypothetical protein
MNGFERYGGRLAQARHKQQDANRSEGEADHKNNRCVKAASFSAGCPPGLAMCAPSHGAFTFVVPRETRKCKDPCGRSLANNRAPR